MGGGDIQINHQVSRVAAAVARVMAVDKAALYGEGQRNRWAKTLNTARALTAYVCTVDLGLSYRQVGEALGYSSNASGVYNAVTRLASTHGLPLPAPRPWLTGKRLDHRASKAPAKPGPDLSVAPKVIAAARQIPVKPRPAPSEAPQLPIAAPPERPPVAHSLGRMASPSPPPPTTVGGLGERIMAFLENRSAATAQTLATCLDAKELTVSQSLSLLKHQGQVTNDAPSGGVMRDTLWRAAGEAE